MKRLICLLSSIVLLASFCGCSLFGNTKLSDFKSSSGENLTSEEYEKQNQEQFPPIETDNKLGLETPVSITENFNHQLTYTVHSVEITKDASGEHAQKLRTILSEQGFDQTFADPSAENPGKNLIPLFDEQNKVQGGMNLVFVRLTIKNDSSQSYSKPVNDLMIQYADGKTTQRNAELMYISPTQYSPFDKSYAVYTLNPQESVEFVLGYLVHDDYLDKMTYILGGDYMVSKGSEDDYEMKHGDKFYIDLSKGE